MPNNINDTEEVTKHLLALLFSLVLIALVLAYIVTYPPFLLEIYASDSLRLSIEFLVILLLSAMWFVKSRPGFIPASFLVLIVVLAWLFLSESMAKPGPVTKFFVLLIGVQALRKYPLIVSILARTWVFLWTLICLQIILAFFLQNSGLYRFPFSAEYFPRGMWFNNYFHPLFGFLVERPTFGVTFARASGYFMESLFFGLYAGLNVLAGSYFLPGSGARQFKILNTIAGFCCGSISFLLFFLSLGLFKIIHRKKIFRKKGGLFLAFFLVGFSVAITYLFILGNLAGTSFGDRFLRLFIAIDALKKSTPYTFFFGNLYYAEQLDESIRRGIAAGFLTTLVQRGVIILSILSYFLYKYLKHDTLVAIYVLYYGMLLDFFWWPAFVIFLILFHCLSTRAPLVSESRATQESGLPTLQPLPT